MRHNIVFSEHAVDRIRKRKITAKKVYQILLQPDKTYLSFRRRKIYQKRIAGDIFELVTVREKDKIIVVTAYKLENVS